MSFANDTQPRKEIHECYFQFELIELMSRANCECQARMCDNETILKLQDGVEKAISNNSCMNTFKGGINVSILSAHFGEPPISRRNVQLDAEQFSRECHTNKNPKFRHNTVNVEKVNCKVILIKTTTTTKYIAICIQNFTIV